MTLPETIDPPELPGAPVAVRGTGAVPAVVPIAGRP